MPTFLGHLWYPPEDSDNGEELERVGVVDVRGHLLQEQVDVEAQRRHVVDYVHTARLDVVWFSSSEPMQR